MGINESDGVNRVRDGRNDDHHMGPIRGVAGLVWGGGKSCKCKCRGNGIFHVIMLLPVWG